MCLDLFQSDADQNRLIYIQNTSAQSNWRKLFQTIFTGATVLQLGTPTMFRGMKFKDTLFWIRDGRLITGMKRAYAEGPTTWGPTSIHTQNGRANVLTIAFDYKATLMGQVMGSAKLNYLQKIYPSLRIHVGKPIEGVYFGRNEPVPEEVILTLSRSGNTDVATFEAQARSLMHTLFSEPQILQDIHLP